MSGTAFIYCSVGDNSLSPVSPGRKHASTQAHEHTIEQLLGRRRVVSHPIKRRHISSRSYSLNE